MTPISPPLQARLLEDNATELLFTVLANRAAELLNASTVADPGLLLRLMKRRQATLNRVFGPASITELRLLTLTFQDNKYVDLRDD